MEYQEKGVLSLEEVRTLLNPCIWPEFKHYTIALLTLATGLRISEVRGLQVTQVHPDYIKVHTAWYRFELYPGVRLQKSSAVDFQQIGLR